MKQILVYADSLSWGIIPGSRERLDFTQRWPGILEQELNQSGTACRIIENCLNGRRTVWEDPFKPGRKGLSGIEQVIEMHSPLALVILMLGTNDFQSMHPHNAWHSAQGTLALVTAIRQSPVEPGMEIPPILLVSPPALQKPQGDIAEKFSGGEIKCVGLNGELRKVAKAMDCAFLDADEHVSVSNIDGVHLDAEDHRHLGEILASKVAELI